MHVVKDQITLHIKGNNDTIIEELSEKYSQLSREIREDLPALIEFVRAADPEHVKRHHNTKIETQCRHWHYCHPKKVTPEDLEFFLTSLLAQQAVHNVVQNK